MKYLLLLAPFFQCCRSPVRQASTQPAATSPKLFFSDSGYSSIILKRDTVDGFPEVDVVSRTLSYHFVTFAYYYPGGMVNRLALIRECNVQHCPNGPTGAASGIISLVCHLPNANPLQDSTTLSRTDWESRVNANQIQYGESYIEAMEIRPDCYYSTRRLIDYLSGKELMELSSDLYGVQRPHSYDRRWIGYSNKKMNFSDTSGVLSYVDPYTHRSQRILISIGGLLGHVEDFAGITLEGVSYHTRDIPSEHWYYSDLKKFYIVVKFEGDKNLYLRVPVVGDKMDIKGLNPDWCSIEPVPDSAVVR